MAIASFLSKRALLTGSALVAPALAVALMPTPARADLSFSDVFGAVRDAINDTIRAPIEGTFEILGGAFVNNPTPGLPEAGLDLLGELLAATGAAGEDAMTLTGRIPGAMERSWPEEAVFTETEWRAATDMTAFATRERIEEAAMLSGLAAEGQAAVAAEDRATMMAIEAAGAAGQYLGVVMGLAKLVHSLNLKVQMQILQQNQLIAMVADATVRDQSFRWLTPQVREYQRTPSDVPVTGPAFLDDGGGGSGIGNVPVAGGGGGGGVLGNIPTISLDGN